MGATYCTRRKTAFRAKVRDLKREKYTVQGTNERLEPRIEALESEVRKTRDQRERFRRQAVTDIRERDIQRAQ